MNYEKTGKQWSTDVVIDEATAKEMKQYGIADRVKRKDGYLDGQPFLSFKQKELQASGKENDPPEIVDITGKPWDQSKRIGNETVVDMKFNVVDFGVGKKKGVYPKKMRVLDHVPFEDSGFQPLDESDEFYQKAQEAQQEAAVRAAAEDRQFKKDFIGDDLDEELPF